MGPKIRSLLLIKAQHEDNKHELKMMWYGCDQAKVIIKLVITD